jgi:hypothetical protein
MRAIGRRAYLDSCDQVLWRSADFLPRRYLGALVGTAVQPLMPGYLSRLRRPGTNLIGLNIECLMPLRVPVLDP